MTSSNPLRKAAHGITVATLSLLLLSAGMCRQTEDASQVEVAAPQSELPESQAAEQEALVAARAQAEEAEAAERERQADIAAAEQELAEREARLAQEEARLRRERELQAEKERLADERAATAEKERQLAARERQLREQEAELAQRQAELDTEETMIVEQAAPEPLPEPTGNYEGSFDEPWRESQETVDAEPTVPPADDGESEPAMIEEDLVVPTTSQVSLQAGERLEVQVVDTLSSETARVGNTFSTRLVHDLRNATGTLVVPAGAEVVGRVTEASAYRRGGGPATLGVEFTEIVVSPEQTVGIRASFVELGADRRNNRKKVVAGAVVGAILGHILGGDGSKNVIIGAAAGAAAGGAVVASAKDRDAEIPSGQIIALQLEEVVTVEIEYGAVAPG